MLWSTTPIRVKPRVRYCKCAATNTATKGQTRSVPVPGSPEDPCADYAYSLAAIAKILPRFPEAEKAIHEALLEANEKWQQSRRPE